MHFADEPRDDFVVDRLLRLLTLLLSRVNRNLEVSNKMQLTLVDSPSEVYWTTESVGVLTGDGENTSAFGLIAIVITTFDVKNVAWCRS